MAENSKIEWTDSTFNPWMGCTKVSPGCEHCYAEGLSKRTGRGEYKKGVPRVRTKPDYWKQPLKWNQTGICKACGETSPINQGCTVMNEAGGCEGYLRRPRVFCASLSDWLDDEVPIEWLADLLQLIHATPNLDWLLLTKRPQNWDERTRHAALFNVARKIYNPSLSDWILHAKPPANVWIGTTVEDQTRANQRIPELLKIPAKVRFLSCEPLLGPVDLILGLPWNPEHEATKVSHPILKAQLLRKSKIPGIDWVIAGGESGPGARPMHPAWARSLQEQCTAAGVKYFFKQWGNYAPIASPDEPLRGKRYFIQPDGKHCNEFFMNGGPMGCHWMENVGKKAAGRLLDGREWNEVPS